MITPLAEEDFESGRHDPPRPSFAGKSQMEHTQDSLNAVLRYEPSTGNLYWKQRDESYFRHTSEPERICLAWNQRFAGKRALTAVSNKGYLRGMIFHKRAISHRIIWMMVHGEVTDQIDHVNGDKSDNRLANLRPVNNQQNQKNRPRQKNNKSGVNGVSWYKSSGRWVSHIRVDGRLKNLGYFDCIAHAAMVRNQAERHYGFHPNHGRAAHGEN